MVDCLYWSVFARYTSDNDIWLPCRKWMYGCMIEERQGVEKWMYSLVWSNFCCTRTFIQNKQSTEILQIIHMHQNICGPMLNICFVLFLLHMFCPERCEWIFFSVFVNCIKYKTSLFHNKKERVSHVVTAHWKSFKYLKGYRKLEELQLDP